MTAIELVYLIEVYEFDSGDNISSFDLIKFDPSFWYELDIKFQNLQGSFKLWNYGIALSFCPYSSSYIDPGTGLKSPPQNCPHFLS